MSVTRARKKKSIVTYEETDFLRIPCDDENCTSLKELRELVQATAHLPDETVVGMMSEHDDEVGEYTTHLVVESGNTWVDVVKEWDVDISGQLQYNEKAILENLGITPDQYIKGENDKSNTPQWTIQH